MAKDGVKTKPKKLDSKGHKHQKHEKGRKTDLKEQVLSMGGKESDLALLEGVEGDMEIVTGEQGTDPSLVKDVSAFLSDLKSGKEPRKKRNEEPATNSRKQKKDKPEKASKSKKTESTQIRLVEDKATTTTPVVAPSRGSHKLVFPPSPDWYSAIAPLATPSTPLPSPSATQLSTLSDKAARILQKDTEAYQTSSASTGHSISDSHFLQTILSKGTLSDRLSALTLLVQASPVHNMKALESLKSMAERGRGKGGREEGLKAMRCMIDWWVGGGAPGRKLRYFRDQPGLLHPSATDQHLIAWFYEDWLKKFFFSILQILETYSLDPLPYVRTQALGFIFTLLRDKPEQEQNLLRLLVNKLGDTEKSVCSRASYHLLQLLQTHPNMKGVIVREIRSLIFRPAASTSTSIQQAQKASENQPKVNTHIKFTDEDPRPAEKTKTKKKPLPSVKPMESWNLHAWYYASVTLNQVVLTPSDTDRDVSRVLIEVYFEMFREVLGGSFDSKEEDDNEGSVAGPSETPHKERKKWTKGKEKEIRGAAGFVEVEDSNSRLISAILTGVNRSLPFAKVDAVGENDMFNKHIDTLFLITHKSTFNISLQALMLILHVITTLTTTAPSSSRSDGGGIATSLSDRFYRTLYASLSDPRLSKSNKQAMYLNLLFKALKVDTNLERVKAFVRRFVQVLVVGAGGAGGTEFVAGGLYLLGELFSTAPQLKEMLSSRTQSDIGDSVYDPRKRDPQYAHASASPLYELLPLLNHYHPAVSLHARQLLTSTSITATADLSLNTLSHFLDRFVYKNPKKPKTKGASAMQPGATSADGASGVKLVKGEVTGKGIVPVNEEGWWKRKEADVAVDEVFFHRFFTKKNEMERAKAAKVGKRKGKGEDSDSDVEEDEEVVEEEEGEGSDKEEAEVWKAMKSTMPAELQDDDLDSDSDDLPSGLDDEDEDGSEGVVDEENEVAPEEDEQDEEEEGSDALSLAEASDADDLLSLDADVPDGLIEYNGSGSGSEDEEWGGISETTTKNKKRKRGDEEKNKRKKLRALPTFASYEDYAKLIEDGPEDDL